ncbi:MAG: hypothetical protein GY788_06665 [bacterium]|nr:hypothetical protein [bacterium]
MNPAVGATLVYVRLQADPTPAPSGTGESIGGVSDGFPWADLVVQTVGGFLGAIFAFMFAIWLMRRQRVSDWTSAMIAEFSAHDMLMSRFVTSDITQQIEQGSITLRDVALTTVQGCPVGFVGRDIEGLTEHQHMSNMIGWYRRLATQLENGWVDRHVVATTLGGSFGWTLPFLLEVGEEAKTVIAEHASDRPDHLRASWTRAIESVDSAMKKARHDKASPTVRIRRFFE